MTFEPSAPQQALAEPQQQQPQQSGHVTAAAHALARSCKGGDARSLRASVSLPDARSLVVCTAGLGATPFPDVRLSSLIGRGSFGSVFSAWKGNQPIAVKMLRHTAGDTGRNVKATVSSRCTSAGSWCNPALEAELGLKLNHPHIVKTLAVRSRPTMGSGRQRRSTSEDTAEMDTCILMELCNGGSLQAAIDEGKLHHGFTRAKRKSTNAFHSGSVSDGCIATRPRQFASAFDPEAAPDMAKILACAAEMASAMAYMHANNVLHGDLTASNVLLVPSDPLSTAGRGFSTRLSDFGMSRATQSDETVLTNSLGTVTHMPLELLREGKLSQKVDVYSFGVLLWEMYTGERPWCGLPPVQIMMRKSQANEVLSWPANTPVAFRALGEDCMADAPEARPTFTTIAARVSQLAVAYPL